MFPLSTLRDHIEEYSKTKFMDIQFANSLVKSLSHNLYSENKITVALPYNALVMYYFDTIYQEIDLNEYLIDNIFNNIIAPLIDTYVKKQSQTESSDIDSVLLEELIVLKPYYEDTLKFVSSLIAKSGKKARFYTFLNNESKYDRLIQMIEDKTVKDWTKSACRGDKIDYNFLLREIALEKQDAKKDEKDKYDTKKEAQPTDRNTVTPSKRRSMLKNLFKSIEKEKNTDFLVHLPILYEFIQVQVKYFDGSCFGVVTDWLRSSSAIDDLLILLQHCISKLNDSKCLDLNEADESVACALLALLAEILKTSSTTLISLSTILKLINSSDGTAIKEYGPDILKSAVNYLKEDKSNYLTIIQNINITLQTLSFVKEVLATAEQIRLAAITKKSPNEKEIKENNGPETSREFNTLVCDTESFNKLRDEIFSKLLPLKSNCSSSDGLRTKSLNKLVYVLLVYFPDKDILVKMLDVEGIDQPLIVEMTMQYFLKEEQRSLNQTEKCDKEAKSTDRSESPIIQDENGPSKPTSENRPSQNRQGRKFAQSKKSMKETSVASLKFQNIQEKAYVFKSVNFLNMLKIVTMTPNADYFKLLHHIPLNLIRLILCREVIDQIRENLDEGIAFFIEIIHSHETTSLNDSSIFTDFFIRHFSYLITIKDQKILKLVNFIIENGYNRNVLVSFKETLNYNIYEENYMKVLTGIVFNELILSPSNLNQNVLSDIRALLQLQVPLMTLAVRKQFIILLKVLFISGISEMRDLFDIYIDRIKDRELNDWYSFVSSGTKTHTALYFDDKNTSIHTDEQEVCSVETELMRLINNNQTDNDLFKQSFRDSTDLQKCMLLNVTDLHDEDVVEIVLDELNECLLLASNTKESMCLIRALCAALCTIPDENITMVRESNILDKLTGREAIKDVVTLLQGVLA